MAACQHILIIEDHEALNAMFCRVLSRAGHRVHGVGSAEDLQEYVALADVETFIVDWNLPDESGVVLLHRLRAAFPNASLIMVTARSGVDSQLDGYAHGADLYLEKPVKGEELLRAVKIMAERKAGGVAGFASPATQAACLHRTRMTLDVGGMVMALSLAEMKVLAAFAVAPDRTLEVWQIVELLLGDHPVNSGHAIEVRMSRLRKKLSSALAGNPIVFIRGVGYRLAFQVIVR